MVAKITGFKVSNKSSMEQTYTLCAMQCAEIDGNATPSDFSVNYYIRVQ